MSIAPPQPSESTSISLLKRAERHDPQAWERLTAIYTPLVYAWCRRWGVTADDAADVCQEVFRAVFRDLSGFRKPQQGGGFREWLRIICRHRVSDHFDASRNRPRTLAVSDPDNLLSRLADPGDDDDSHASDAVRVLHAALETIRGDFQESTWAVFWRSTIEGQDAQALARDLNMTSKAVRQAKHRVLKRLREELDGLMD